MIQNEGDVPVVEMPEVPDAGSFLDSLKGMGLEEVIATVSNSLVSFAFKVLVAVAVFYIGRFLISRIYKAVYGIMTRRHVVPRWPVWPSVWP